MSTSNKLEAVVIPPELSSSCSVWVRLNTEARPRTLFAASLFVKGVLCKLLHISSWWLSHSWVKSVLFAFTVDLLFNGEWSPNKKGHLNMLTLCLHADIMVAFHFHTWPSQDQDKRCLIHFRSVFHPKAYPIREKRCCSRRTWKSLKSPWIHHVCVSVTVAPSVCGAVAVINHSVSHISAGWWRENLVCINIMTLPSVCRWIMCLFVWSADRLISRSFPLHTSNTISDNTA